MKIGIRKSPHLDALVLGIEACGDILTSVYDMGCDVWLCWGWPQAEQVMRDGAPSARIICVDAHPFALMAGDRSGDRILQLGNWGALARYPSVPAEPMLRSPSRSEPFGPTLVLGQVYTAEQRRLGLVDTWHTGGYEQWVRGELAKPNRKFRKHPRVWMVENSGQVQPSLADDLRGCFSVASWNSTAGVHAQLLGYPATAAEPHGWAHMELERLAAQRVSPAELRSGRYWGTYREWLAKVLR